MNAIATTLIGIVVIVIFLAALFVIMSFIATCFAVAAWLTGGDAISLIRWFFLVLCIVGLCWVAGDLYKRSR